jgi:predicted O-methyltransferase YrrM
MFRPIERFRKLVRAIDPGLARRRKIVAETPQVKLADRHVAACRLVTDRAAMLRLLPQGAVVAELGVASGRFSAQILARTKPATLVLVDLWDSNRYDDGLRVVREKFADQIADGTIEIRRGYSTEQLAQFPDGHFDWVYIDTDHSYRTTIAELELAAAKVRPGGLICGHDFTAGNAVAPVVYGVIQACGKFCADHGWRYKYLSFETSGLFSFCLEKIPD